MLSAPRKGTDSTFLFGAGEKFHRVLLRADANVVFEGSGEVAVVIKARLFRYHCGLHSADQQAFGDRDTVGEYVLIGGHSGNVLKILAEGALIYSGKRGKGIAAYVG